MDDTEFDRALIAAVFDLAARKGWGRAGIAQAAREADLPLDRARLRFPGKGALLLRLGRMADAAALEGAPKEGPARDRLFDMLMRRIDVLQAHREGVRALMQALPAEPGTALLLAAANLRSMAWFLEAAGISASGPLGTIRAKGLLAVWIWILRAWQGDASPDLAATMSALDNALARAERAAGWLPGGTRGAQAGPEPEGEPSEPDLPAAVPDLPPEPPPPPPAPPEVM